VARGGAKAAEAGALVMMTGKIPTLYAALVCVLAFVAGAVITAATRVPPVPQVPRVTLTWGAMRVEATARP
jgi:hypothetical protein